MEPSPSIYQSYLLRLWCENHGENWRAMLECTSSKGRYSFSSLENLFAFIQKQTQSPPDVENGDGSPGRTTG
ncbi:MAG: hypothetical protein JXA37_05390 [Chloroflexia bacterium]|nr:hypothetical protein [Chloroflexia bacterium]